MKTAEEIWHDVEDMEGEPRDVLTKKYYSPSDVAEIKRKLLEEVEKLEEDVVHCIPDLFTKKYRKRFKMFKQSLLENKTEVEK